MCSVHGWPLTGQCGGSTYDYWSSTPGGTGLHYLVNLNTSYAGSYSDDATSHVACVR
jgi:hypothetical protein